MLVVFPCIRSFCCVVFVSRRSAVNESLTARIAAPPPPPSLPLFSLTRAQSYFPVSATPRVVRRRAQCPFVLCFVPGFYDEISGSVRKCTPVLLYGFQCRGVARPPVRCSVVALPGTCTFSVFLCPLCALFLEDDRLPTRRGVVLCVLSMTCDTE